MREGAIGIAASVHELISTVGGAGAKVIERFAQSLAVTNSVLRFCKACQSLKSLFDFQSGTTGYAPPRKEYEVVDQQHGEEHCRGERAFQVCVLHAGRARAKNMPCTRAW